MFLVVVFLFQPLAVLHADGGAIRFSERRGDYRITVFTSPNPLRAGPVDISVFVQDAATGEPVPDARIAMRVSPREHRGESTLHLATTEAATNKLFQAALFDLPESGVWDVEITVDGLRAPVAVHFDMEAEKPLPRVGEMTPWIAWPALVVLLFFVHRGLLYRKQKEAQRIKKASSPKGEPALVMLSPNQHNNI